VVYCFGASAMKRRKIFDLFKSSKRTSPYESWCSGKLFVIPLLEERDMKDCGLESGFKLTGLLFLRVWELK